MGLMKCRDARQLKDNSRSVLFVTSQLRQREIKMAYALRSCGWMVGLIYYHSTPFDPKEHFDWIWEVQSANAAYARALKLSPKLVHVFSGAIDDYVMVFCRNKMAPTIVDLNDIFTQSLMKYCNERFPISKEALDLADGYCARDLQVKYAEKFDGCRLPKPTIFFPEYCWDDRILPTKKKTNNEIHIVSVGTISLETYGMLDCCYFELTKMMTHQRIHLHFYPPWHYRKDFLHQSHANFEKDYAQFLELEKNNPYLHVHDSLPVDQLIHELPKYDFGIISGGCKQFGQSYTHFKENYVQSCYSGRISDYLDAGLPVLVNKEVKFNYRLLKHYGVGINLKDIFKPGFKAKLLALKQDSQLAKNMRKAKQQLSLAMNAARLEKFYTYFIEKEKSNKVRNKNSKLIFNEL